MKKILNASEMGKIGGKSTSEKKRIAARLNGKLGGYRKHKKVVLDKDFGIVS